MSGARRCGDLRSRHQEWQPADVVISGLKTQINCRDNPLLWLRTRRTKSGAPLIDAAQYEAGCRLAADYRRAGLDSLARGSLDMAGTSGRRKTGGRQGGTVSDAALDARQRYRKAVDAVGPDFAPVLNDVCCIEVGLGDLERKNGWPPRSGKFIVRLALSALARHYGLLT